MTSISPEQAREYLKRWSLVAQRQAKELRTTSLATKGRQLAVLMASRDLFVNDRDREREVVEVRERWARIRQALHA